MSWQRYAVGCALVGGVVAGYACKSPPPTAPTIGSVIPLGSSYADVQHDCLAIGSDQRLKLCWRADPLHRGMELSIPGSEQTPLKCLRASAGSEQLAFVDASDTPTRSTLEVDARLSRPAFVVGWKAGKAPSRAASGWRFGHVAATEVAPPSFRDVMAELSSDLRIEVYDEACENLCPERPGKYSLLVSPSAAPTAHENRQRVQCGTFDLRAHNRLPPNPPSAPGSGGAGSGGGGGAGGGGAGGGGAQP